ncbi:MAG TPA: serine/threonine-protein kinase [Candidatus Polarisedimenticolaceae bacterium]|nr:serine/threonine-protein kinase [Candidatus Polarisedimenticolaceae bacterium]
MDGEARLTALAARIADHEALTWEEVSPDGADARVARLKEIAELCGRVRDPFPVPDRVWERWGSLEIRELLGAGGFGRVYRAWDPALQREVALKLGRVPAPALEEARRLARVRHPNVLQVHGVAEHDGQVGIWTELVEGASLEERLRDSGPMGAEEAAHVGRILCAALAAVHGAGLLHRDVKTANVVRERGGRLVLLDFSSAAPSGFDLDVSGTPLFMAPEVLAGGNTSRASDLYGVGVVLYRLVTGAYPVEATTLAELKSGARIPLRDRRPDLPGWFTDAVERAIDPDPASRFASAGALDAALARGERRRFRLAHAAVLLTCLAVAAAIFWGATRERPIAARPSVLRVTDLDVAPLPAGAVLRRGDRLALELALRRPAYVYVVDRDARGSEIALFPLEGLDLENPLPAGADHRLPGTIGGKPYSWEVTTEGGAETLMVVVSRDRLPELEAAMGRTVRAGEVLRGMGGLAPGGGSKAKARPSSTDVFRGLREQAGPDLWAWETTVGGAH